MTTAYTSLLGLALPVTGELSGTWGDVVNDEITALLDAAIAGTTTLSSDADVTLTTTSGAANQARAAILLWTAAGTVTRNITAPALSKGYFVINATGSTQSIVLRGVGPTAGITIVAGERCVAAWNGSDFVKVSSSISSNIPSGTTLVSPVLTTPQINDTSSDHQYIFAVNELAADRTVTLPLLLGNDTFVFADFIQTLTNKTLTAPVLTAPQINDTSADHQYVFAVSELAADRTVTLPLLTADDTFVFAAFAQTLTNKTLTNPTVTNYVETLFSANTGTSITLNLANGTVQNITSTGSATVTMPTAVAGKSFIMYRRSGTGSFTITWSTVKWSGGTAPTLTATASRMDIFSFFSDGTNWYGTTVGLNYTP